MKTLDTATVVADPVISEVRRAKTAVAEKYGFDVIAMVRALREMDEEDCAIKTGDATGAGDTPLDLPSSEATPRSTGSCASGVAAG
jgi:hypothetical protein